MHEFYKRQVKLIGEEAQLKLNLSKVLIIGAGGLGHPVASYLTGAGVGQITIVDFDKVELSNLHRQTLFKHSDCGKNKSEVLASHLQAQNPFIEIQSHSVAFNQFTSLSLLEGMDLVIDATDNFTAKFLIHENCYNQKIPLLQASISSWHGNMHFFDFQPDSPCLECLYPTPPQEGCVGNCADEGILGSTAGVFGTILSHEALKYLMGKDILKTGTSFLMNSENLETHFVKFKKNIECRLCYSKNIENKNTYEVESVNEVHNPKLIDLRLPATFVPNHDDHYILYCHRGVSSLKMVQELRQRGFKSVWSLRGGISSLNQIQESCAQDIFHPKG